jgi:hypothetical protein
MQTAARNIDKLTRWRIFTLEYEHADLRGHGQHA